MYAWAERVLEVAVELGADAKALIEGGAPTMGELGAFLTRLVQAAEIVVQGPGRGSEKRAAVRAVLRLLDRRYEWRQALERAIKLPRPLEWAFFRTVWPFLEGVMVDLVVAVLNATGGWVGKRASEGKRSTDAQ